MAYSPHGFPPLPRLPVNQNHILKMTWIAFQKAETDRKSSAKDKRGSQFVVQKPRETCSFWDNIFVVIKADSQMRTCVCVFMLMFAWLFNTFSYNDVTFVIPINICGVSNKWTVKSWLQLCEHQSASIAAVVGAEGAVCGVWTSVDQEIKSKGKCLRVH